VRRLGYVAILALSLAVMATQIRTQPPHAAKALTTGTAVADQNDIDPNAIAVLNKMGTYLRTLKAFQVQSSTTTDDVLEDGQIIQYATTADILARTPDRLRLEVNGDRQHRIYFYNGKDFTLFAPQLNYYGTVPAPSSISKLFDALDDKYDIQMPLRDLFEWGTPNSDVSKIKSATDIGPSSVGGTTCEQYAFRQEGLDWQIWIQNGDYPLPRKLVLATLTDDAHPQHSAVLTWNLAPSFNDAAFTFDPPKDAQKIVFANQDKPASPGKP
jgi:hypothetical protein